LDIDKDDSDAWNNLTYVLSIVNRTDNAKHAIDIALKKIDKMRDLKQENGPSYYHTKGITDFQLGDQKESICSFKKANNMLRSYFYSTPVISI
jgi:tetratricopeptide (TPR) repeat protein